MAKKGRSGSLAALRAYRLIAASLPPLSESPLCQITLISAKQKGCECPERERNTILGLCDHRTTTQNTQCRTRLRELYSRRQVWFMHSWSYIFWASASRSSCVVFALCCHNFSSVERRGNARLWSSAVRSLSHSHSNYLLFRLRLRPQINWVKTTELSPITYSAASALLSKDDEDRCQDKQFLSPHLVEDVVQALAVFMVEGTLGSQA